MLLEFTPPPPPPHPRDDLAKRNTETQLMDGSPWGLCLWPLWMRTNGRFYHVVWPFCKTCEALSCKANITTLWRTLHKLKNCRCYWEGKKKSLRDCVPIHTSHRTQLQNVRFEFPLKETWLTSKPNRVVTLHSFCYYLEENCHRGNICNPWIQTLQFIARVKLRITMKTSQVWAWANFYFSCQTIWHKISPTIWTKNNWWRWDKTQGRQL
jgi:hypothetical protein